MPAERTRTKKQVAAAWLRWLHIYISMVGFMTILFFAVTGLTLNHADWFFSQDLEPRQSSGTITGALAKGVVQVNGANGDPSSIDKLAIAEHLRATHKLSGKVEEFAIDEVECMVLFKGPAYAADVAIDRETGKYVVNTTYDGVIPLWNDLHKGRHTGGGWSWVIDISAILMTITSLTGLGLLFFLKRRRAAGLLCAAVGTVLLVVLYVWLVP